MPMHAWEAQARAHFCLTTDPTRGGFVLRDGGLLDLVTKGREGCVKVMHDTIANGVPELSGNGDAVRRFISATSAIRIHAAHRGYRGRVTCGWA